MNAQAKAGPWRNTNTRSTVGGGGGWRSVARREARRLEDDLKWVHITLLETTLRISFFLGGLYLALGGTWRATKIFSFGSPPRCTHQSPS